MELNLKKYVSSSPHIRDNSSTARIMFDVVLALLPAAVWGIWKFGFQAFLIIASCIIVSVLSEYLYEKTMHRKVTVTDGSAVVTGLLIALNMPPEIPVWIPMLGCVFAIIIVKQLFGGLGQNFMNPALAGRCFLLVSFAGRMTSFSYDAVTTATPLAILKAGGEVDVAAMFLGNTAGTIGEVSTLLLLLGAAYLLWRRVIEVTIPLCYLGSFAVFSLLFGGHGLDVSYLAAQLCGGGLMLGAWFMATDYVTSPITTKGKVVFGVLLGILTGIFRTFGNSAEGVSYAIIFANLLVPFIDQLTMPKAFGKEARHGRN